MKIPFSNNGAFPALFKSFVSGVNATIEFNNLQSPLFKVGVDISKIIGLTTYDLLCDATTGAEKLQAKEYLQRAQANFALYEHFPFLVSKIGNDGVTIKKNDNETTIFRSQQNDLKESLITTAWFWMNALIAYLNANSTIFTAWAASDQKKEYDALPIHTEHFNKWVSVSDDAFVMSVRSIIAEVWRDCVLSRIKAPELVDDIARAVVYEVMYRSILRLDYYMLPKPIRIDVNTELGKDHAQQSDTYVREKVANIYLAKSKAYWDALDLSAQVQKQNESQANISQEPYTPAVDYLEQKVGLL